MTHPNASPKVTVILPTYNRAAYLTQAIDSIRAQTLTDWELIIIDDASGDTTPEMVRTFTQQDSRIRYHRHRTNQGVAIARNTGLKHASSAYIAFQDDDDLSHPERLQKQADYLDKHPNVALLYTHIVKLHVNEPINWHTNHTEHTFGTLMVTRAIYQRVPFRPFFITLEDSDFIMRAAEYSSKKLQKTSAFIEEPLYAYRAHENAKRLGHHPLIMIYDLFWRIARAHRQHGLKDPIDNAKTTDEAICNIHPQFSRYQHHLHQNIANFILAYLESPPKASPENQQYARLIGQFAALFSWQYFQKNPEYRKKLLSRLRCAPVKSRIDHSIRHHDRDTYLSLLRAINRLNPNSLRLIAPKILSACIKQGRYAFILPYLRALV